MLDGLYRFQEDSNYLSTFSSVEFTCSAKFQKILLLLFIAGIVGGSR